MIEHSVFLSVPLESVNQGRGESYTVPSFDYPLFVFPQMMSDE